MKPIVIPIMAAAMMFASCTKSMEVEITNPLPFGREETIEIPFAVLADRIGDGPFRVVDSEDNQVPSQLTYDSLLVFRAHVDSMSTATYTVQGRRPAEVDTLVTGRAYPEHLDDYSWENSLVGFRVYGVGRAMKGEYIYGHDLWLKRTNKPVSDKFINLYENPELREQIVKLQAIGRIDDANKLADSISYNVDHGEGVDCYPVHQSLGAAGPSLLYADTLVFPLSYTKAITLDKGPVRHTVRLLFAPRIIGSDTVQEERLISLDEGEHFNRTRVSYHGLTQPCKFMVGIAIHDELGPRTIERANRYISYQDSTSGQNNGTLFLGALFRSIPDTVGIARGHVAIGSTLAPDTPYSYFWGFGWDKADVKSFDDWNHILWKYNNRLDHPVKVKYDI